MEGMVSIVYMAHALCKIIWYYIKKVRGSQLVKWNLPNENHHEEVSGLGLTD